jgi:uncharacterized iron-regulated protein
MILRGRLRRPAWALLLAGPVACAPAMDPPGPPAPAVGPDAPEAAHPVAAPDDAWRLLGADGSDAGLDELVRAAAEVEVVFVGERHGNPGGHRFQRELLEAVLRADAPSGDAGDGIGARTPVLSLEMFERDVQPVLDEYLDGLITEEQFLAAARPWESYRRDYRPLVELAREHRVPVIAANAPRRYVNRVARLGPESLAGLPDNAFRHLPPIPYPGPSEAYREEWNRLMGDGHAHAPEGALHAQALWDAAMAHAVAEALDGEGPAGEAHPDMERPLVIHLTGAFHVENRTGTPEALEHYRPGTRSLVVVILPLEDPAEALPADAGELGDYLVVTRAAAPPRP